MKTSKFSKKLVLNKKTIADLSSKDMKKAKGGYPTIWDEGCPGYTFKCPTACTLICLRTCM